jgi:hypothetical protein
MSFEYDIFISYGHLDDENPDDVKGWVDMLVERLPGQMQGHLAYKPRVWRDERSLRGNDLLQAAIKEGVESSLLFVPVVTPRYVLSGWCRRELEMFCSSQPPACPSADAFRSRIFKIIKMPLTMPHVRDKEPEHLREMVGYEFYEMEGDMPVEFSPDVQPAKDMRYWTILRRLAWEMTEMLGQLKPDGRMPGAAVTVPAGDVLNVGRVSTFADFSKVNTPPEAQNESPILVRATPAKVVYLAETTSDLSKERELVRDELRQRGYGVLPEKKLPVETSCEALASAVRADVERCTLSVHLVGVKYGSTPEDDVRSVVRIQEELAAERSASAPDFRRILWMPPGLMTPALEVKDSRQKEFVTELQSRIGEGSELLQTSVEDLKTRIVEKLDPPRPAQPARVKRHDKLKQIYLICDDSDRGLVKPIKKYLFEENFEVITWLDSDAADKLMEYHRKNLKECDAALIYFGGGDEPWVRMKLQDLEKAYGYGREDDWCASAVYVGAPQSEQKEDFLTHMVPYVIRNFSQFKPEDLRDFVGAVRAAEGGQGQ